jgi:hypothetical protein
MLLPHKKLQPTFLWISTLFYKPKSDRATENRISTTLYYKVKRVATTEETRGNQEN